MQLSPEMEEAVRELCEMRGLDYEKVRANADRIDRFIQERNAGPDGVIAIPREVITGEPDS